MAARRVTRHRNPDGEGDALRPLAGRHIVITRAAKQAPELARQLEALGARVTTLSTIAIEPVRDPAHLDAAIAELASYDWIVFTSVNGVRAFASRLAACGRGWDERQRARVAVIGPATARALAECGVSPDLMPDEYVAEAILKDLGNVAGQRILLVRADIARRTLAEQLAVRGAEVDEVAAYRTVARRLPHETLDQLLGANRPDAITFTSSSTVRGLIDALQAHGCTPQDALGSVALVAIGPITAATLRSYYLEPAATATVYTIPGLVRTLVTQFGGAQ